jgi:hypothetical protein
MNPGAQSRIAEFDLQSHPEGGYNSEIFAPRAGCSREITAPSVAIRSLFLGETTGETTSHPTKQPKNGCQVVGYSHSTRLQTTAAKSLVIPPGESWIGGSGRGKSHNRGPQLPCPFR